MKLSTQKGSNWVKIAIFYRCAHHNFNFFANTWNFLLKLGTHVVSRLNRQEILTKQLQFNPTPFSSGKTSTLDTSNFPNLMAFPTFLFTDSMEFQQSGYPRARGNKTNSAIWFLYGCGQCFNFRPLQNRLFCKFTTFSEQVRPLSNFSE